MTQNIYDTPEFFAGYSRLPRSVEGLPAAPEWPTLQSMLPDLQGRRVADLGCGFGWFCRWARDAGAAAVLGLDVSENMLARARETTGDPAIRYERADLEALALAEGAFDLVYSSLALHYIENLRGLFQQVRCGLVPGGRFVFSVEHPMYTAPGRPAWTRDPDGRLAWPVNSYAEEGTRSTDWLAKGVIKQHRTVATYANLLIATGFTIARLEEWSASADDVAAHPDWAGADERPSFLLMSAQR
ncbi:class I SAM-dependent methyltransferase [uncultured Reyranella sp.]|uniref:class I SAM-dependent methyltransferase n=1 Tax=uncultured Reyranella sp. TaxID=735512 RepID=UPI0025F82E0C|nr:class I SAM-dependent methyltransferase [uncultured Reyranella sp.]